MLVTYLVPIPIDLVPIPIDLVPHLVLYLEYPKKGSRLPMRQTPEPTPSVQESRARQVELFTSYLDSLVRNLESQLAESSTDTIALSKKDLGDLRQIVDIVICDLKLSEDRANRLKEELLNTLAYRHYIP